MENITVRGPKATTLKKLKRAALRLGRSVAGHQGDGAAEITLLEMCLYKSFQDSLAHCHAGGDSRVVEPGARRSGWGPSARSPIQ
jgi:hypothetical protein